jgi:DNA-binding CsgD family transcriptional regulator
MMGAPRARGRGRRRAPEVVAPDDRGPEPPSGLRAYRFLYKDEEYLVLSFPVAAASLPDQLTDAERVVLRELLAGKSNAEIAGARGTSPRTVANQISSLYRKLGVASRAELAARFGASL